ncbi:MAG: rod shape-determining protein MreD [Alphaproteobacteria bacterium]|nr:rod shape-determining protein MreD [Alphaproteobacteria bacterium]
MPPVSENKTVYFARSLLPFLTTLAMVLAGVMVWPVPFLGAITPSFGLVAVYYWSIHRPDLFRPVIVFIFGLLNDILHFYPIGLTAVIYLIIYQLSFSQRRFFAGQIFYMLWFGFVVAVAINLVIVWIILSLNNHAIVPLSSVLTQFIFTIILFPFPAWLLIRLQRLFLSKE